MKNGVKILVVLFLLISVSGCCKRLYPVSNIVHDTVTVTREVRLRDTTIIVDSAKLSWDLSMDSLREMLQQSAHEDTKGTKRKILDRRNKQAHLVVTNTAAGLHIDCNCDTMSITAQLRDSLIKISHQRQEVKTVVQEKKYVPLVVKILAWMGGILALGIIGFLVKKFWL